MKRRRDVQSPGDVRISVRVPATMATALRRLAAAEDRTLSAEVRRALRLAFAERKGAAAS